LRDGREVHEHFSVSDAKLVRAVKWSAGEAPKVTHPDGVERQEKSGENSLTFTYFLK
jgi:hypothetical protein